MKKVYVCVKTGKKEEKVEVLDENTLKVSVKELLYQVKKTVGEVCVPTHRQCSSLNLARTPYNGSTHLQARFCTIRTFAARALLCERVLLPRPIHYSVVYGDGVTILAQQIEFSST